MEYKVYVVDGEELEVKPHEEEQFLKNNPTAKALALDKEEKQVNLKTNEVSEPIKSEETDRSQINQQEDINENTENVDFINKYNKTLNKYIEPNQTESDFLKSLTPTQESVYHLSFMGGVNLPVKFINGVTDDSTIGTDDPRYQPEKYKELEFLHKQLNAAHTIKEKSVGKWYDGMNSAEIVSQPGKMGDKAIDIKEVEKQEANREGGSVIENKFLEQSEYNV